MFSSVHFSMTSDWQTVPFNQYFAAIVLSGVYGLFILASWHKFCVVLFMSSCKLQQLCPLALFVTERGHKQ